jgi:thioredoxin-related protein
MAGFVSIGRFGIRGAAAGGLVAWLGLWGAALAADGWHTEYEQAMQAAASSGRPVLTIFTGSDWCPHCRTLERNVLETDAFRAWAEDRVVLLMIDLPQSGISHEERKARSRVCVKYGVRIFPSALLIAPDGSKITLQTGYTGQAATTWVTAMSGHLPATGAEAGGSQPVHASLDDAVASARTSRKPVLVMVSRSGDAAASKTLDTLVQDPEFKEVTRDHFVVASVPTPMESDVVFPLEQLRREAAVHGPRGEESVELIVTEDGRTPLLVESGSQPPQRIVTGLRRFLAARQTNRR